MLTLMVDAMPTTRASFEGVEAAEASSGSSVGQVFVPEDALSVSAPSPMVRVRDARALSMIRSPLRPVLQEGGKRFIELPVLPTFL